MGRLLLGTLLAVVTAAATALWFISYRNQKIESLYAAATGRPGYWRSSLDSVEAVRKLATYRGQRSSRLLLDLATGKERAALFSDAQVEAIRVLRDRSDPGIAAELASLLQPHNALIVRTAAAHTLENLPC